jgi:pyruvate formate lyase activating enzyme
MKVNLGGIVPLSTVDWTGRAALVVFLRGCPLRCPHCQNQDLQEGDSSVAFHVVASRIASLVKGEMGMVKSFAPPSLQIDLDEASERVRSKPFVNAFVISGGEPLMQHEQCTRLFRLARSLHLDTGLETSGCYPERLRELLKKELVDKVFLDIKANLIDPDYERATAKIGFASLVRESLRACMESGVPLDVRTTIFPKTPDPSEVTKIARTLFELKSEFPDHGLQSMVLQQGRPREGESGFEPVTPESLNALAEMIKDLIDVQVRAAPKAILEKVDNSPG